MREHGDVFERGLQQLAQEVAGAGGGDGDYRAVHVLQTPGESFDSGIRRTVAWYLDNQDWIGAVTSGAYQEWVLLQYAAIA